MIFKANEIRFAKLETVGIVSNCRRAEAWRDYRAETVTKKKLLSSLRSQCPTRRSSRETARRRIAIKYTHTSIRFY